MIEVDVADYLSQKNIPYKIEGNELVIYCPECNKPKLYLNRFSGLYHCFVCEAEFPNSPFRSGNFNTLKELFGDIIQLSTASSFFSSRRNKEDVNYTIKVDEYHQSLIDNKKILRYLKKRGLEIEIIKQFKLGHVFMKNHDWISIPSFEDGVPKLLKYRQVPPEDKGIDKYIREVGSKSILFNSDVINKFDIIIICEGELDAISLIQAGYENVIGVTGGAGTLLPEWYEQLSVKQKLYLVFDADQAGQNAARDVWASRLGLSKCYNINLPDGLDVNDFMLRFGKVEFDSLLEKASLFKIDGILSLSDALYEMYTRSKDTENIQSYELPWKNVNKLLGGGLVRKRLTVLGGIPGIGKTSWALQVMHHLTKVYQIPTLFFCMEMPETALAAKIVQLEFDLEYRDIDYSNALIWSYQLEGIPIYFGYSSKVTPQIFYNTMKVARDKFGVQAGTFDNLQRMVRSDSEADMAKASGMFKDLVMDLNIMLLLVSQPRKLNDPQRDPTYDDLKGSSAIPADADEVIILHRRRDENKEGTTESSFLEKTKVLIEKSRFASGGMTYLKFLGGKSRFEEFEDIKKNNGGAA